MPIAAHTAGGHSTLDVLIGLAILMWALAGAALLVGWLWRLARQRRTTHRWGSQKGGLLSAASPAPRLGRRDSRARRSGSRAGDDMAGADNPSAGSAPHAGSPAALAADIEPLAAPPPAIPGARLSPEQLEPLGRSGGQQPPAGRRRRAAEQGAGRASAQTGGSSSVMSLFAAHPIPFLVLRRDGRVRPVGDVRPAGHGAMCRSSTRWPAKVKNAAAGLRRTGARRRLPGVRARRSTPRWWYRAEESRAGSG